MIKEAIEKVQSLTRDAKLIEIVHDDLSRQVITRTGSDFATTPFPPVPRSGTLVGLDDLLRVTVDPVICSDPEVYVDQKLIVVLVDRHDRHDRIVMKLDVSSRFAMLQHLSQSPKGMTSAQMIQMLRFDLPSDASSRLIASLRKVNFQRRSDGSASVEHGRESFGKSVEAAVQQVDQIAESVDVTVPVFMNPGLQALSSATITCGIHINPGEESFVLRPLADTVSNAVHVACVQIRDHLQKMLAKIPVIYGSP